MAKVPRARPTAKAAYAPASAGLGSRCAKPGVKRPGMSWKSTKQTRARVAAPPSHALFSLRSAGLQSNASSLGRRTAGWPGCRTPGRARRWCRPAPARERVSWRCFRHLYGGEPLKKAPAIRGGCKPMQRHLRVGQGRQKTRQPATGATAAGSRAVLHPCRQMERQSACQRWHAAHARRNAAPCRASEKHRPMMSQGWRAVVALGHDAAGRRRLPAACACKGRDDAI